MALSDACFEFVEAVGEAAKALAEQAHHYSAPDYPIKYGVEIEALKRAARDVAENPFEAAAVGALVAIACKVQTYLDASPDDPELKEKKEAVNRIVKLMVLEDVGDAYEVRAVVNAAVTGKGSAATRAGAALKSLLGKLQKPAYEAVVKAISDVASASVKKILGL